MSSFYSNIVKYKDSIFQIKSSSTASFPHLTICRYQRWAQVLDKLFSIDIATICNKLCQGIHTPQITRGLVLREVHATLEFLHQKCKSKGKLEPHCLQSAQNYCTEIIPQYPMKQMTSMKHNIRCKNIHNKISRHGRQVQCKHAAKR
jgi:pyruvate/oxaloacetate carboxyltransferase